MGYTNEKADTLTPKITTSATLIKDIRVKAMTPNHYLSLPKNDCF